MVTVYDKEPLTLDKEMVGFTFVSGSYLGGYDGIQIKKYGKIPKKGTLVKADFSKRYKNSNYIQSAIPVYSSEDTIPYFSGKVVKVIVPKGTKYYEQYNGILVQQVIISSINKLSKRIDKFLK